MRRSITHQEEISTIWVIMGAPLGLLQIGLIHLIVTLSGYCCPNMFFNQGKSEPPQGIQNTEHRPLPLKPQYHHVSSMLPD
jgi:hypothetical protein